MAGEADIKALDKRVGGIERKLDELDKSLRAAGDFKALEARVKALEQICKTLMEARTASKAEAAKMIANVALLNEQTLTRDTVAKLFDQERKSADAQATAQAKTAEASARALVDKSRAEVEAQTRKAIEQQFKAMVEARLAAVEQMAKAAMSK
jgi:hypothetical protein